MRHAILLPVLVALGTAALVVSEVRPPRPGAHDAVDPTSSREPGSIHADGRGSLDAISAYRDPDIAFDMAVPAGWTPIVAVDESSDAVGATVADALLGFIETGHVVGFEAPRDAPDDAFADYVMVEILPGADSGQFLTDGSRRRPVTIDGRPALRDWLRIDGPEVDGTSLDLVVLQAEIRGLGWTIGFYAIGEPSRARLMEDAFELMIRTFHLEAPPFRVSRTRDGDGARLQRVG